MKVKEFGYEYETPKNEFLFQRTYKKFVDGKYNNAYCLRSCRDALKIIAKKYAGCHVLLPALSCSSMITPFEAYDCKVIFYKLDSSLKIDLIDLMTKLKDKNEKTVFLYMDYFGIESITASNLHKIKEKHSYVVFVKDITHTLLQEDNSSFISDYIVASVRKWLPIPDGGFLWSQTDEINELFEDNNFYLKRLNAQNLRYEFLQKGEEELKKVFRSLFLEVNLMLDSDDKAYKMSQYSYELIKNADIVNIKKIRQKNAEKLISILKRCNKIKIIQDNFQKSNLYVPFAVDNRDEIQKQLSKKGIFNTIIWPLRIEQKKVCEHSRQIEEHMLAAPCDQRYTVEDMEYIGNEIVRVVNEQNNNDFRG